MKPITRTPKSTVLTKLSRFALLLAALSAGALSAHAASGTWNGTADAMWANTNNWSPLTTAVPGTGDLATFNNALGATTIDLGGGVTISNLLFDTASTAAYTLGAGAVGSQALTLDNAASITLNAGVANNQLFNANLSLSSAVGATATIGNNSSALLTIAGGIAANAATGNGLLTVSGSGNTTILGAITKATATTGTNALLKTGAGTLTLSTNSVWTGSGALGRIPATSAGFPMVVREGTLLQNGGTNTVNGELVIGGVVADGGAGQNAKIVVDGSTLNVTSWFSVGRGNGVGGVSSDLVLTNAAVVTAANFSAGYNGGNATNFPKGSITLHSNSTFTITGNGNYQLAENAGSDMTMTLNNTAQVIANGTGIKRIGYFGKGTLNINDNSLVSFGNQIAYVGYRSGTGIVNQASGTINTVGEVRVGGSDTSGTGNGGFGTYTMTGGTANFGALTVGRGNNNQNQCSGEVFLNGGTMTSTNDVILGYAGTNNYGRLTINGGTFNVGPAATKWLMVGSWDYTSGRLDINSGAVNLMNNTSIKMNRQTGIGGRLGGNEVNQNGGTVTFYSDAGTTVGGSGNLDLVYSGAAASSNTYNLNGGTLTVPQVACTTGNGTRAFNFNGGTLKAAASTAAFFNLGAGTTVANVRNGGAIIDSNGKDITIAQPLVHSTIDGDAAVDGGLTKNGAGSLTLSGGSTYTGNTVINGGTLNLNSSTVTPATPGALTINNATVNVDATSGSALPAASVALTNGSLTLGLSPSAIGLNASGNFTLQNSAVLNLNYGGLTANPTTPAINVSGGLTAPGSIITINVGALGLKPGQFELIKYTGTTLANLANFNLVLPAGVNATLENNTGNHSIDLNISLAPKFLTWFGAGSANWDIGTTVNWKDGALDTVYQQYTNWISIVGDAVLFDDTLTNDFVNPQPTNINLTASITAFPIILNNSDPYPYSFTGAGTIAGAGYLVKSNTGSLTIGTSNSFTGGTFINGGSVIITNDYALGATVGKVTLGGGTLQVNANTTNTARGVSVVADSSIGVVTNATLQLGGVLNGAGGLTKIDNGTLTLTGSNGITGSLSVNQGILRNTGTEVLPAVVRVGNTAGINGVLALPSGTFSAANNGGQFASSLIAGGVATSAGDIVLNSGTLAVAQQLGLGAGQGGYGALTMSGGTLNCGSYIVVGFNNDRAVFNQSSGTTTISSNLMTIAAGGTGSFGVANISGGTFTSAFGLSSGIMVGERGVGTLNVSGAAVINVPTNAGVTVGPVASQTGWDGTLNLNGGTVTANRVARGVGTGSAKVNFNGGTLKASTANANFLNGMDSATVYANGLTIDDGGFTLTVAQPLQGATDYGVSSISLANGGSGYIDSPIVIISGGSGSNATATATVSGGVVTAVTVTCPGSGYLSGEGLSVTFDSGGAAVTAAVANTPVLAANLSGGLTKKGAGTLNLTGANSYTNTTTVSAGTLMITPAQVIAAPVAVASNATFGVVFNTASSATVGKLTLGNTALDRTTLVFALSTGSNPTLPVLTSGPITVNGTNTIRLAGTIAPGTFPLLQYSGAIGGAGVIATNVTAPQGQTAMLSNSVANSTLYVIVNGTPGIVWTGTNSVAALTNVWNLNSATNWLAAGVPTFYQETTPPGDPVTFNDLGRGQVLLSNTVSPASMLISNNTVNYVFRGTGHLSGSTGVDKEGSGTATLGYNGNDYSGNTIVGGGTLQLGSGTTIPDGATAGNVIINPNGTLDLNGFSDSVNGLNGTGIINNSGGTTGVLTNGNNNANSTWTGIVTNTGAGGVTFNKIGTGAMTLGGTNFLTGVNQFNGGSLELKTNAQVTILGTGEFWVGASTTATFTNNGGTLIVPSWLVVGRTIAAANGTMVINAGTVQKTGGNNVVVGSVGATGVLTVNGGQLLNNANLWLGENATANGTLNLNGGLVQATQVRFNGTSVASSTANMNGGTMQATAGSTNYFAGTIVNILAGGLTFDDGGFAVTNLTQSWVDADGLGGGLIKKGAGALYLDTANSYTGLTLVTNGTLAGIGSLVSPVVVAPSGTLGAGDAGPIVGTFTINNNLTLQGNTSLRVDKTGGAPVQDNVNISGNIHYGGVLTVTNITSDATPLTLSDTFQLFSVTGSKTGNFTSVVGSPGAGLAFSFDPSSGVLSIVTGIASNPTNITATVSGNVLTLTWPADHIGWILQTQTNTLNVGIAPTAAAWTDVAGSDAVTTKAITMDPANPTVFFRLKKP